MATPGHIHWRDLNGGPGSSVIFCGRDDAGFTHTGKLWRVTCPNCILALDATYSSSKVIV